jgi:hypothetical protein
VQAEQGHKGIGGSGAGLFEFSRATEWRMQAEEERIQTTIEYSINKSAFNRKSEA